MPLLAFIKNKFLRDLSATFRNENLTMGLKSNQVVKVGASL